MHEAALVTKIQRNWQGWSLLLQVVLSLSLVHQASSQREQTQSYKINLS